MLTLNYFTKFPAFFKEREKLVNDVIFTSIQTNKTSFGFQILTTTDKYQQEIQIYDNKISLKSPVKVSCTCESFKYEFANAVYKSNSLINPIHFLRSIIKRPKHRNIYNIPSGCKHIVALSRFVLKLKL